MYICAGKQFVSLTAATEYANEIFRKDGILVGIENDTGEANKVMVKSLMTGEPVLIDEDTPWCCNPASESFWSM